MATLDSTIEAILFWKGEPVSKKELSRILKTDIKDIEEGITALRNRLHFGITLLEKDEEVCLSTESEAGSIIQELTKEELSRELTKPQLETLSIILYKGPVKRSEIDYIRGVNSQFILRHLEMRGLIEKVQSENDLRAYEYKPTFELLSFLGISNISELPEFDVLREKIEEFEKTNENEEEVKTE